MSAKHLTPQMIARTVHVIDSSGILDILVPPREPGARGRIGARRPNTRLLLIGLDPFLHDWDERFHAVVAKNLLADWWLPVLRPNPLLAYARTRRVHATRPPAGNN